jgi:glycosyltransferase involved in cell wall biosynthesis
MGVVVLCYGISLYVRRPLVAQHRKVRMKTLVFDARCIGSGIGTYSRNLLSGLKAIRPAFSIRAITHHQSAGVLAPYCDEMTTVDSPIYSLQEQITVPWVTRGSDAVHALNYNAPLLHRGCLLVSIYDLTHILDATYRRSAKSRLYARPMLRMVTNRVQHIFTLSEYSKCKLTELLGVSPSKITVTYCGVGPEFCIRDRSAAHTAVRKHLRQYKPFVIFIGNLKPHKNVITLIRAFANLVASRSFEYDLLIVGDDRKWKSMLVAEAERLNVANRVRFVPPVEAALLPFIYSAAELLVQPSFEEGFGLPVLEAMASGTPVVCSRAASLPEVGGDAVAYFDPQDADELSAVMESVLTSAQIRDEMREKGLQRAACFSWKECVQKHFKIYQQILSN